MDFITKEIIYQKSSQEITALLYEVLIDTTHEAIKDIQGKQYIDANLKLKKASDLLERLGVGLNYEAGIMADQLDALYNYMADLVIKANIHKEIALLEEVVSITEELATAWRTSMKNKSQQSNRQLLKKASAYEKNVMVYENNL
ncbi:flagellar export chaperone FliS [Bacillus sp. es.034]|uniref:flagellar export chaperone FliS n=1 Tax=Bacillus sp. es.034 TaxID=1761763 RepID=UPI000BF91335|nr:flagellar export chaperone FliS [Bacillus sp. es.034]PFG04659.1 flagellar protein FliS [Bacillus sp. es.034]